MPLMNKAYRCNDRVSFGEGEKQMETKPSETKQIQTWYGITATVTIGPGFLHRAGWGDFLIPHPPVVNWLLRLGLKDNERRMLSFIHEFGHLQSAIPAHIYMLVNLAALVAAGRASFLMIILVFICTHAAWEFVSEIITIANDVDFYRKCYEKTSKIPRIVFWVVTSALSITGWIIVL